MDFAQARDLFVAGVQAFEAGRFEAAEAQFRASLAMLPGRASTLTNLGATLLKRAQPQQALGVLQEALAAEPDNLDAWCHRGAALAQLGRDEEALASYDRALLHAPLHAAALYHRAYTLNALQRPDEALPTLEQYLALQPAHAPAWLLHGETLQALDRHDAALGAYDKALAIDPTLGQAWSRRGTLLRDAGRLDEAATCFEKALAHGADAELNGYFLAALRGGATPPSAPGHYVEFMFDGYADKFDQHLVQVLQYRAPQVLMEGLVAMKRTQFKAALDLGCGTGLCGPLVKPLAMRLEGVDLSRNMLDRAATLGVYDALTQADIHAFLRDASRDRAKRYDLVLSADVFIYVGDLDAVFQGVRSVIERGGVFCFSAELAALGEGFLLQPSLRYAHSEPYLRELAQRHGFEVGQFLRHPIRQDQRRPIDGLFAFLVAA
jgi:predicted TPR repeat methyltransferase